MRTTLFLLVLAALCLTACASSAPTPIAEPLAPAATSASAPLAQVKTDFTPTDPTTVSLAAGRPQLVEFYAVW
jgi:hypothetical protein